MTNTYLLPISMVNVRILQFTSRMPDMEFRGIPKIGRDLDIALLGSPSFAIFDEPGNVQLSRYRLVFF